MKKLFLLSAAGLMAMASCRTYCPAYSKTEAPKANTATAKAEQPKQVRG